MTQQEDFFYIYCDLRTNIYVDIKIMYLFRCIRLSGLTTQNAQITYSSGILSGKNEIKIKK